MFFSILSILVTLPFYLLVVLMLLWCWFQWTHREFLKAAAKIHCSIPSLPVIGHALHTTSLEGATKFLLKLAEEGQRQGLNSTCFWAGPLPLVLVFGLDDVQKILTSSSTVEKGDEYDFFKVFAYERRCSVLTASNEEWKITRRHMNPLFHQRNLEQLVPVFNRNSRELVSDLEPFVGKGEVNVFEFVISTSLQSITNLVFGMDIHFDKDTEGFKKARHGIDRITELVAKETIQVWPRIHFLFEFVYKNAIQEVRDDFNEYIKSNLKIVHEERKRQTFVNESNENNSPEHESDNNGLFSLIKAFKALQTVHPRYDDLQFFSEALTLLATGTDTLGLSVSSSLLILAQYQQIQERLYEEILSVGGADGDITTQDINKMVYLDQVIKESMRFTMVVPIVIRKTTEVLELSQCTLPAGSSMCVCIGSLGMDPRTFPDPQKIDPDRFAPENSTDRARYSFLPFSGGSRNCIGKRYAEILVKLMVVHILRKYRLTTRMDVHNLTRICTVILVSTEGYNIQLHPRT